MSILILIFIIVFLFIIIKHPRGTDIAGKQGEYLAKSVLYPFTKYGAEIISNCYLPLKNGNTTEIDLILLYKTGIFVIEVKNHSGWIYGDDRNRNWVKTVARGRYGIEKISFYNPVMQNRTHINALRWILKDYSTPIYNIVAFADTAKLMSINVTNPNTIVVNFSDLGYIIESYDYGTVLSSRRIESYKKILEKYTSVSDEVIQKHNSFVEAQKSK